MNALNKNDRSSKLSMNGTRKLTHALETLIRNTPRIVLGRFSFGVPIIRELIGLADPGAVSLLDDEVAYLDVTVMSTPRLG